MYDRIDRLFRAPFIAAAIGLVGMYLLWYNFGRAYGAELWEYWRMGLIFFAASLPGLLIVAWNWGREKKGGD